MSEVGVRGQRMRRSFADVVKDSEINLELEYEQLKYLFYEMRVGKSNRSTLRNVIRGKFKEFSFRGSCHTLEQFEEYYEIPAFDEYISGNLDDILYLAEYILSFAYQIDSIITEPSEKLQYVIDSVENLVSRINYKVYMHAGLVEIIEDKPEVTAVVEIVDQELANQVLRYNHRSLKGDVESKKSILLAFSHQLEPRRRELRDLDQDLSNNLFFAFNTLNIRHNNLDGNGKNSLAISMEPDEIESWYDETYQLCLIATLILDNVNRNKRFKELRTEQKSTENT